MTELRRCYICQTSIEHRRRDARVCGKICGYKKWALENPARRAATRQRPERERNTRLQRLYGISGDEYDAMYEAQSGKCMICGSPPGRKRLCVDHCHVSGKVRALLCDPCNVSLGAMHDDPELLTKAADYVRSYR